MACVIVEPVAANMGLVAPAAGFLEGLRAACDRAGALLDLRRGDHRLPPRTRRRHRGGRGAAGPVVLREGDRRRAAARRARGRARPHVAARSGGPVYQAGTLSGNPARDRGGAGRPGAAAGRRPTASSTGPRPAARRRAGGSDRLEPGSPSRCPSSARSARCSSRRRPCATTTGHRRAAASGLYAPFFRAMLARGWRSRRARTRSPSCRWPIRRPISTAPSRLPRRSRSPPAPCGRRCRGRRRGVGAAGAAVGAAGEDVGAQLSGI